MDDYAIIELYFARDEAAIAETADKYGRYLYTTAYNILSSSEDAEECENDTYLAAWNAMPPERPRLLLAFLSKITRNLSFKRLRAKRAEKRGGNQAVLSLEELAECIPAGGDFNEELERREFAALINRFLLRLPIAERRAFICRYFRCESIAEIAKRLGYKESRVKMMLQKNRKQLFTFLEKEGAF